VINRGVKQLAIFQDDEDRLEFIDWLKGTTLKYPVEVHHYSLMTNHYHLLLRPLENLSKMMQYFSSHFAAWLNKKYRSSGHLFQGRFHSIPVEEDRYYTTVSRYIHLNAVRAGIVRRPEDYRWCNYGNLIYGIKDPLANGGFLLDYFGTNPDRGRQRYRQFVEDLLDKPEPVTTAILLRMRSWGKLPQAIFRK
jgi:REP element-mobilizing transposase RayT